MSKALYMVYPDAALHAHFSLQRTPANLITLTMQSTLGKWSPPVPPPAIYGWVAAVAAACTTTHKLWMGCHGPMKLPCEFNSAARQLPPCTGTPELHLKASFKFIGLKLHRFRRRKRLTRRWLHACIIQPIPNERVRIYQHGVQ